MIPACRSCNRDPATFLVKVGNGLDVVCPPCYDLYPHVRRRKIMEMDPQIKALAAMKRELAKIVSKGATDADKLMLIEFGERRLAELKADLGK